MQVRKGSCLWSWGLKWSGGTVGRKVQAAEDCSGTSLCGQSNETACFIFKKTAFLLAAHTGAAGPDLKTSLIC